MGFYKYTSTVLWHLDVHHFFLLFIFKIWSYILRCSLSFLFSFLCIFPVKYFSPPQTQLCGNFWENTDSVDKIKIQATILYFIGIHNVSSNEFLAVQNQWPKPVLFEWTEFLGGRDIIICTFYMTILLIFIAAFKKVSGVESSGLHLIYRFRLFSFHCPVIKTYRLVHNFYTAQFLPGLCA